MFDILLQLLEPAWDAISDCIGDVFSAAADHLPELAATASVFAIGAITITVVLNMSKLHDIVTEAFRKLQSKGKIKNIAKAFAVVENDPTFQVDVSYFDGDGTKVGDQTINTPNGVARNIRKGTRVSFL